MQPARTSELRGKAEALRRLHVEAPMLVLPNAWDAGSARIFVAAGFPALATTSAGIAFSLGFPDGEQSSRHAVSAAGSLMPRRVSLPVLREMGAGYSLSPSALPETLRPVLG